MLELADIYSKYKALIFDLDGTLIDSEPLHLQAWNEINTKYNLPLMTLDYMKSVGGISTAKICAMYCRQHQRADLDTEAVAIEKGALYKEKYMASVPLNPKIASILCKAHNLGLKTAVATGSQLPETKFLLKKHALLDKVDAIVTSDQVAHCKPAPDTYLTAAMRLSTAPSQCLVFEDTLIGLQGIKAAGMTALQVLDDEIISDFIYAD